MFPHPPCPLPPARRALAHAGPAALGPAGDFNIFVFGDDTQGNSDTEGRVAVGGNAFFSASGWTIGTQASGSTTNLIVGGNLSNTYNTVHGNVLVNGNVNWTGPTIQGSLSVNGNATFPNSGGQINGPVNVFGTYSAPNYFPANQSPPTVTPLPFNFASVKASLQGESNYLAGITPNGTTTVNFGLRAHGVRAHRTASTCSTSPGAYDGGRRPRSEHSAPTGSTVVVNVDGTSDSMQNMSISLNGVDNQHVLYNFSQATSLTVNQIGVEGTILAPNANVTFTDGQINGTLIAQSVSGQGESHQHLFIGNLPTNPIPEPSTFVLAACGLAAFVGARAYRRTSRESLGLPLGISCSPRRATHTCVARLFCAYSLVPLPRLDSSQYNHPRSDEFGSRGPWSPTRKGPLPAGGSCAVPAMISYLLGSRLCPRCRGNAAALTDRRFRGS